MKTTNLLAIAGGIFAILLAFNFTSNIGAQTMSESTCQSTQLFPLGNRASNDYFTGTVHVQSLLNAAEMENLYTVGAVTFSPGARTHWHTHPIGQTLIVTEGSGFYQERGKAARPLKKGDVVAIPKDVEHWHGAAKDSKFVHIAISNMSNGSNVTWMTPVTDEEYVDVNR